MNIERIGKSEVVNKESLRVQVEAGFIPANTLENTSGQSAKDRTIGLSDQHSREELVSALGLIMNRLDIPETALDELEGNQEARDRMTVLAGEYLRAVKSLDTKRQKEVAEQVRVILG